MTSSRPYRKTPLTHEQAVAELEKFSGIQFDPEIVPVLVNLPREVLDRRPDRDDELPTMLHAPDPRDRPPEAGPDTGADALPDETIAAAQAADPSLPESRQSRPMLASDDVS